MENIELFSIKLSSMQDINGLTKAAQIICGHFCLYKTFELILAYTDGPWFENGKVLKNY